MMLGLMTFVAIVIIGIGLTFNYLITPVNKGDNEMINFNVESGSSMLTIATNLKEKDLVKSKTMFLVYAKIYQDLVPKAGTFKLNKAMSLHDILNHLNSGSTTEDNVVNITLTEGETIVDLANKVAKLTTVTKDDFLKTINNQEYLQSLITKYWFLTNDILNKDIYYSLEGYLYPQTHNFYIVTTPEIIIEKFLEETNKQLDKYKEDISKSKYNVHELFTLASMTEKEGKTSADRKNIIGVFVNRLNINMPLGSDVTAYYAFDTALKEPYLKKWDSTYNAYNTRGPRMEGKLPIGPINNPSLISIEAAIGYTSNNYLYFVADKNMKVHFMETDHEFYDKIDELKQQGMWN